MDFYDFFMESQWEVRVEYGWVIASGHKFLGSKKPPAKFDDVPSASLRFPTEFQALLVVQKNGMSLGRLKAPDFWGTKTTVNNDKLWWLFLRLSGRRFPNIPTLGFQ